ncbi:hypothetical protein [Pseudoalteromonas galatheae]|uniref:hypothetical protein n=1 Tax=Pseudoalteromonas galatheae TaxID=579562 RepID=UPI0030CFA61B
MNKSITKPSNAFRSMFISSLGLLVIGIAANKLNVLIISVCVIAISVVLYSFLYFARRKKQAALNYACEQERNYLLSIRDDLDRGGVVNSELLRVSFHYSKTVERLYIELHGRPRNTKKL